MKVQDILTDESKWCQGRFWNMALNQRCLAAAIYEANETDSAKANETLKLVKSRIGYSRVSTWNDAPERTFTEVRGLIEELDI